MSEQRRVQILYVTTTGLAAALCVHRRTVIGWVESGQLRAMQHRVTPHWTDPVRKTQRGRWLIELDSVEELLTRMYDGQPVPPGIKRRLRAMASPKPNP